MIEIISTVGDINNSVETLSSRMRAAVEKIKRSNIR